MGKGLLIFPIFLVFVLVFTSCGNEGANPSSTGVGGSMAKFAVLGDYLYVVSGQKLQTFDVKDPSKPSLINELSLSFWNGETIFPYKDHLYIGTSNGMLIFSINSDGKPIYISSYRHITTCDPVVVNDNYAFVTLRSDRSNTCGGNGTNRLDVIDISKKENPVSVAQIDMNFPMGLGIIQNKLMVCDNQVKIFDISTLPQLTLRRSINLKATDVIPIDDIAILVGENGINQYHLDENNTLLFLSKIK